MMTEQNNTPPGHLAQGPAANGAHGPPADILTAALAHAARGWPVFPCSSDDKRPLTPNGFKNATTDAAQIEAWWRRWPKAMIGVPMSKRSGVFCVDLDRKAAGKDGVETWSKLAAEHGVPETMSNETPSTGQHKLFRYVAGVRSVPLDKLGPGLEIKGEGGYIIVPPSRRFDGCEYHTTNGCTEVADAPAWLLDRVKRREADHSFPDWLQKYCKENPGPYIQIDPEDLPPPLSVAEIKAALSVVPSDDYQVWFEIGSALWATLGDEGWPLFEEWSEKTKEKYDTYKCKMKWDDCKQISSYTVGTIFHYADEANPRWRSLIPVPRPILTLAEWVERDLPPRDNILGELLSTTTRMLLSADTGLGKTMFTMAMGMRAALGVDFLHWGGVRPARVLYIDGEMSRRLLKHRLVSEAARLGCVPPETFFALNVEDVPGLQPLNTHDGQMAIEAIIREYCAGVDLIIFDNIMALIAGEHKEEEGWAQTLPWIRDLTKRAIGQLWVHHSGHDASRQYGTKTREWQMDTYIHLEKVERPDADVSFLASFRKAREREPTNRKNFANTQIALVNDCWIYKAENETKKVRLSPEGQKFFECLSNCAGEKTIEKWRDKCVEAGLLDMQDKRTQQNARTLLNK